MLEGGSDYFLRDGANRVFDRVIVGGISALVKTFREFVEELGKALIDFGKKLIGAFETALQEVKTAVEKVVDVIASIVEWIKEAIINAVMSVVNSIKSSLDDFYDTLIQTIGDAFDEYRNTGRLSGETQKTLNSVLNFNYLYVAFAGMVIAIDAIAIAAGSVTFGSGYLIISAAVPLIILAIVKAFTGGTEYETGGISGLQPNLDLDYIFGILKNYVDGLSKNKKSNIHIMDIPSMPEEDWKIFMGFLAILFSMGGWITTLIFYEFPGMPGITKEIVSTTIGALSWWVFGIAALIASGVNQSAAEILGLISMELSVISFITLLYDLPLLAGQTIGQQIAFAFASVFSAIGIVCGRMAL